MAKPDITLARFADGPGEDVLAPSSGLRDTGFVSGTPIVQSYVNELFNQHYQWAQFADDEATDQRHSVQLTHPVGPGSTEWDFTGPYLESTGSTALDTWFAVPFEVGDEITGLEARVFGDGAADVTHKLTWYSTSAAGTDLVSATDTNRAAAWGTFAPAATSHVMAAGEQLLYRAIPNAAGYRILSVQIIYSRP